MPTIHPSAVVSADAVLAPGVEIGPGCVLSGPVTLGEGVRLIGHVHLSGPVTVGEGTEIYPFACVGFPGQDFKFKRGDRTAGVRIGKGCILREGVTVHAATNDHTPTSVGDRVFMMAYSHAGHDARIGDSVIMVNGAGVAGHGQVGDGAILSGAALVHQFCRIGRMAFISGGAATSMDVPPFCILAERQRLGGVNLVGMRRAGIPREQITEVRRAFRDVFRKVMPRDQMVAILRDRGATCPAVMEMAEFVAASKRGICHGPMHPPRLIGGWIKALVRGDVDVADDEVTELM